MKWHQHLKFLVTRITTSGISEHIYTFSCVRASTSFQQMRPEVRRKRMRVEREIMLTLSCRINSFNVFCLEWVSKECSHTTCTAAQQHAMFLREQSHRKPQLWLLISCEQNIREKSLHLTLLCSHYNIVCGAHKSAHFLHPQYKTWAQTSWRHSLICEVLLMSVMVLCWLCQKSWHHQCLTIYTGTEAMHSSRGQ